MFQIYTPRACLNIYHPWRGSLRERVCVCVCVQYVQKIPLQGYLSTTKVYGGEHV